MDDLDFEDDEIAPTAMEIAFRQATGETLTACANGSLQQKQRYNSSKRRKMQDDVIKRTLNYSHE